APRDTIVSLAKKVADLPAYKDHRIDLVTHCYLTPKDELGNTPTKWLLREPYQVDRKILKAGCIMLLNANNRQQLCDQFVQHSSPIVIVLSGHFTGEGYKTGLNDYGNSVHQILFDAQAMGGGGRSGNGGDGWLRILEFFPDDKPVKVRTFSPLFGISPTTQEHAWKKDVRNEYTIELD